MDPQLYDLVEHAKYRGTPYIAPGNGQLGLVVIVENPNERLHRAWQGSVMNVIAPQCIVHHRWPKDDLLTQWEDLFDANMLPGDLTNDQIIDLLEVLTPAPRILMPELSEVNAYADLLDPFRERYMGRCIRIAYRNRSRDDNRPIVAVVPSSHARTGSRLFAELQVPTDNSPQIGYFLVEQAR